MKICLLYLICLVFGILSSFIFKNLMGFGLAYYAVGMLVGGLIVYEIDK